ncbi:MAG: glycosyltransferase [Dongiaceae bacterium]
MRILFASYVPHLPDSTGGLQTSVDALAKALIARGHEVMVLSGIGKVLRSVILQEPLKEKFAVLPLEGLGYPLARAEEPVDALPAMLAGWRPDIAVLPLGGGAQAAMTVLCLRAKVPVMLMVHNVDMRDVGTQFPEDPLLSRIANSAFTARRLETLFGITPPIIPPLIDPATCVVDPAERGQGDCILLINPSISKGVEIFFRLAAARPKLRFLAVESWTVSQEWRVILHNRAAELGNVEVMGPTRDMRQVYRRTRLLLMPSSHEETWGKAATEAQLNGIPVIAMERGALPETVGPGGLLVPIDQGIEPWLGALDRLTGDTDLYLAVSKAALAHATRDDQSVEAITRQFLALLQEHIARAKAAASGHAD